VIANDGGRYYGPYPSAGKAYETLNLLNRLFPYRKCEKKITGHDEVCLYYHLKQCTAPCISAVSRDVYMHSIDAAALFLSGRGEEILTPLEEEMNQAADAWNFERAAELRDRVKAVKHVLERQKVVSVSGTNADVIAAAQGPGGDAGIQVAFLRNGKIFGSEFFPMQATLGEPIEEVLSGFVSQFYNEAALVPPTLVLQHALPADHVELVTSWLRERRGGKVEIVVPARGDRKKLVEMVAKSAADNLEQNRLKFLSDEQRTTGALTELAAALDLPQMPKRIECYDISNSQGTNNVAAWWSSRTASRPRRSTASSRSRPVEGANDFASMKEVLTRRFRRAPRWPTSSLSRARARGRQVDRPAGPDHRRRRQGAAQRRPGGAPRDEPDDADLRPGQGERGDLPARPAGVGPAPARLAGPVPRPAGPDEAHRFANAFHQARRQKTTFQSALDEIPGSGRSGGAS
jgi:excinuclease ABC subunit C